VCSEELLSSFCRCLVRVLAVCSSPPLVGKVSTARSAVLHCWPYWPHVLTSAYKAMEHRTGQKRNDNKRSRAIIVHEHDHFEFVIRERSPCMGHCWPSGLCKSFGRQTTQSIAADHPIKGDDSVQCVEAAKINWLRDACTVLCV
jgi:hypothetical protein